MCFSVARSGFVKSGSLSAPIKRMLSDVDNSIYKKGTDLFKEGSFLQALNVFDSAMHYIQPSKGTSEISINRMKALCYAMIHNPQKGLNLLEKVTANIKTPKDPKIVAALTHDVGTIHLFTGLRHHREYNMDGFFSYLARSSIIFSRLANQAPRLDQFAIDADLASVVLAHPEATFYACNFSLFNPMVTVTQPFSLLPIVFDAVERGKFERHTDKKGEITEKIRPANKSLLAALKELSYATRERPKISDFPFSQVWVEGTLSK